MNITIQRRAEIALRSLQQNERKQILKSLQQLEEVQPKDLWHIPKLQKLPNDLGKELHIYQGNRRLRLILSIKNNICIVEDILDHDKLGRLVANLNQQ